MTINYNPTQSIFFLVVRYAGTVLPLVFQKPSFWILMSIQACFSILDHWAPLKEGHDEVLPECYFSFQTHSEDKGCHLPPLDWDVVGNPVNLLIYFIVFYSNRCYERFFKMWEHCYLLMALSMEWCARLRMVFDTKQSGQSKQEVQAICWRSARRVIASLQLLFFALNGSGIEVPPHLSRQRASAATRPSPALPARLPTPTAFAG